MARLSRRRASREELRGIAKGWFCEKRGRSRPFAVLAHVPISCTQTGKVLFGEGLKNYERKTVRKPVRKTEFRSVFRSDRSCLTRLFGFQRLGGDDRGLRAGGQDGGQLPR
jgi:hypothetical protein